MKKLAALSTVVLAVTTAHAADAAGPRWGYRGAGAAERWGDLHPDYAVCKTGREQSPIDIRASKSAGKRTPINFNYAAGPAEVVNNGHTIQVNLPSGGNVELASGSYQLLQFHFHAPSEEKINGRSYPLVAHLVHRNADGKLAVVGVLFKQGKTNAALEKVFAAMPAKADVKAALPDDFNAADLLPAKRGYYAFMGSLTTPPCSEQVRWQVLKTPVEVSAKQLAQFRKLYPMNARPVQPLHGRKVEDNG